MNSLEKYVWKLRLSLKKPFKLSNGIYDYRENVFIALLYKSFFAIGEAPVVPYYGHTVRMIESDLEGISTEKIFACLEKGFNNDFNWSIPTKTMPARFAVESAIVDLLSQMAGVGYGKYLGIEDETIAPTSFTVTGSTVLEIINDAKSSPSSILKVKAGVGEDLKIIKSLREEFPEFIIRIDVNRGWTLEEAQNKIGLMEKLNIELIEEPITGSFEDMESLSKGSPIPIFIDESLQNKDDLLRLKETAPSIKGVVVKLAKAGGPVKAMSLIHEAQKNNLDVMISSMVESSVGVSAAAAIAPLCKYVDLDSPYLFENDPFDLVSYSGNVIAPSDYTNRHEKIKKISAKFPVN